MAISKDDIFKMTQLAGVAGLAPDAVVRVRAQALDNTLSSLIALRSALFTIEANAEAQFRDLQVAIVEMKERL